MNQYNPLMPAYPMLNGNGAAPAAADPMTALMEPAQAPALEAPEPVYLSPLDRLVRARYPDKLAGQLQADELDWLTEEIRKIAAKDKEFWADRDTRMRNEQQVFELANEYEPTGMENKTGGELRAEEAQSVTLPVPYSYVSKLTNMLAGAGLRMHMPATALDKTDASQTVENFARHYLNEQTDRMALSGGVDPIRQLAHYAVLRGWMAVLQMPKSLDPDLPFLCEVEDPIYIYPRFARGNAAGPIRVTRQYTMTALEAKAEYPEALGMLEGYQDDDEVQIVGYYDEKYHCLLLCGKQREGNYQDRELVLSPREHGVKDFRGSPVNPWLVVMPLGDLSGPQDGGKKSTALYGPGALFALHEIYNHINRLASMLLTQVAKMTDPADITFIRDGKALPEPVRTSRGAHNYLFYQESDYRVLDMAPNPGNFQPLFTLLLAEMQKVTLPSVFYGESGAVTSGYGVGLLTNAAMDIIRPYAKSLELMVKQMLRRMLEISYHVTQQTHGSLPMLMSQGIIRQQVQGVTFDPSVIARTGVQIQVKLGEITPQDKAAASAFITAMVSAGVMSRYSARVEAGIDDPQLEFKRIALESLLMDPVIGQMLGPLAAELTDDELFLRGMQMKAQLMQQQQMAQGPMQPGEDVRQNGQGDMPNNVLPTEMGSRAGRPPAGQDAGQESQRANAALLMSSFGGSPPRQFPGR